MIKKSKAIKILKKQKNKLDNPGYQNSTWILQTRTYITKFFGYKSEQWMHIASFSFTSSFRETNSLQKSLNVRLIKDFLDDCIETIKDVGLTKEEKKNWFFLMPNWVITVVIPSLCLLSFYIGLIVSNQQNVDLKQENKELKQSILISTKDLSQPKEENQSNPKQK
ncbi:MAG: hypothetical protein JJE55_01280 [Flavobacteriaceae bacterium]|nr:hypothetical protein [Flavobacteriaceae bacterium]